MSPLHPCDVDSGARVVQSWRLGDDLKTRPGCIVQDATSRAVNKKNLKMLIYLILLLDVDLKEVLC